MHPFSGSTLWRAVLGCLALYGAGGATATTTTAAGAVAGGHDSVSHFMATQTP